MAGMVESPEAALARNVRLLAIDPRAYDGLLGAGRAALRLGDAQAAIGFFGRAEEVNPLSWVPKWGQGAALVAMEEPQAALGYFGEAQRLGASLVNIAADRGLAFDLLGKQPGAQADYRVALGGVDAIEARRRLALSLAVAGKKAEALATLDPLLARRDPGALRARAFVLALSGDPDGARNAANIALPGMAAVLDPFFRRLPGLQPAEKVAAVHFGHFPEGGSSGIRVAAAAPVYVPPSPRAQSVTIAPRIAPPAIRNSEPLVRTPVTSRVWVPPIVPFSNPRLAQTPPPTSTAASTPPPASPTRTQHRDISDSSPLARGYVGSPRRAEAANTVTVTEPVAPLASITLPPPPVTTETVRLAELDRVLAAIPGPSPIEVSAEASRAEPKRPDPKIKAAAAAKAKVKAAAELKEKMAADLKVKAEAQRKADAKAKAASPGRFWVQLAGGSAADRMPAEYKRLKAKRPALFAKRTGYVAELRGWSRLLIGPFKSEDEAQDVVNDLKPAGINAFGWASPAGQAVEKLPAR